MLKFLVTGQQLQLVTPLVVSDTHNYQSAIATFRGEQWQRCTKWAHFLKDGEEYIKAFHDDMIRPEDQLDLGAGTWTVYIHGNVYDVETGSIVTRITTGSALLKVEGVEQEKPFPTVEASFAETLAGEVENAYQLASGVRQDAASGVFDGATFIPAIDPDGMLSWTNNKGMENPHAINIKGERGEDGHGFAILGYFNTVDALEATIAYPNAGDAYGVGTEEPYSIYIWDALSNSWKDNGPIQGARGEDGTDATIQIGTVETVDSDQPASVENVGTPSAAKFNFKIPKGYSPVKGTDYWTEADKQSIGASITPQMLGAIPEPNSKASGQYLKYNGTGWEAAAVAAGVSSVDGQTGAVVTHLEFSNVVVPASSFTKQANPTYEDFPYVGSIPLPGVTTLYAPDVRFSGDDAISQRFHVVADSYSGGIYIYATSAAAITIPSIIMLKAGRHLTGRTNSTAVADGSVTTYFTVEVPANWTEANSQYTQTIAVTGILENDKPKVDIVLSDAAETAEAEEEAYACVRKVKTADGSITIVCREAPETAFTIQMEVNRK